MKNICPNYKNEISDIVKKIILSIKSYKELENKNKYNLLVLLYRIKSRFDNLKYYSDNYYKCLILSDYLADYLGILQQRIKYIDYYSLKMEELLTNLDIILKDLEKFIE